MPFESLREAIEKLEKEKELVRIKDEVSPDLEISTITYEVSKKDGPALLFEKPKGKDIPVLTNLFGSPKRINMIFGIEDYFTIGSKIELLFLEGSHKGLGGRFRAIRQLFQMKNLFPKLTDKGPCQEIIIRDVDLLALPVLKCWEKDAGPFITAGLVITKDPITKKRNMGMYRMQVIGKDKTFMHWHPHKGGALHLRNAKELKEKLDVAVAIGADPITIYSATAPLLEGMDEFMLSGFLRGKPIQLTKCITCPLEVPASSEIVLEGFVDPEECGLEGPFGDHTGFYTPPAPYPVFHVRAITMRRSPIYHAIVVGHPKMEDSFLGKVTERLFLPLIKMQLPEVVDINLPPEGVFHNLCFVSIDKRYAGHAQKVMHALWGMGQLMFTKILVVFDKDVDVQDLGQVLFYLGANVDPSRDILITKGPLDVLDHAPNSEGIGGKIGIDATKKFPHEGMPRPWPEQIKLNDEVLRKVKPVLNRIIQGQ